VYIHPSRNNSREIKKDIERQNITIRVEFSGEFLSYLKEKEKLYNNSKFLARHEQQADESKIHGTMRSRMIDWMIEVLTNFKCDDQRFFTDVSLMDRYFRKC
jgi:hypothetical protein